MASDANKPTATTAGSDESSPATAKTTTKESAPNAPIEATEVKVALPRSVTYRFTFPTGNVVLRYAYQISKDGTFDGTKGSEPAAGAKLLSLKGGATKTFSIPPGGKVRLFLNSDALATFRTQPVYEVKPDGRDVIVKITEKTGVEAPANPKLAGPETITIEETSTKKAAGKGKAAETVKKTRELDQYTGELSGALWMQISHRFTAAEAEAYIPSGTAEPIRKAVRTAYSGPPERSLVVQLGDDEADSDTGTDPLEGQSREDSDEICRMSGTIRVNFHGGADKNARENIAGFDFLKDGLPRTHPNGLIAVLNAAMWAGVTEMTVTSAWRPLLGSVAHRTGLGLDLGSIRDATATVVLNRSEFKDYDSAEQRYQSSLKAVTKAEGSVKTAETDLATRTTQRKAAEAELTRVEGEAPEPTATPAAQRAHEKLVAKNKSAVQSAKDAEATAQKKLDKERATLAKKSEQSNNAKRDRDEAKDRLDKEKSAPDDSALMQRFRAGLADQKHLVTQLFDPWQMDTNTRDAVAASENTYQSANEKLHINHLHVTAYEPSLL
jgi:hypothetical protein